MATSDAAEREVRRGKRKEVRFLQSESVWLQKALFALRKAEDARESLAETRGEAAEAYRLPVGDGEIALEDLDDGLDKRIEDLMKKVREMRRSLQ